MKLKPPADIHEAFVEKHHARAPGGEVDADPAIAALARAVRDTRLSSEQLAVYADQLDADRTATPDTRRLRLRDTALALGEKTAKKLDDAKTKVRTEIEEIDALTGMPPALRDSVSAGIEAEIRARLASMSDEKRNEAIGRAFAERDGTVIAAVLRGPALLTGLSQSRHDLYRQQYRTTFHPDETARRARLVAALDASERSGRSFVKFIAGATSGAATEIAMAQARVAETEAAIRAASQQE